MKINIDMKVHGPSIKEMIWAHKSATGEAKAMAERALEFFFTVGLVTRNWGTGEFEQVQLNKKYPLTQGDR